jgi:hypothetical protein
MRSIILALLLATPASAQNIWQMNNAYQNQFNNAYAQPYVPVYTPRYYAPVRTYSSNRYLRRSIARPTNSIAGRLSRISCARCGR